MGKKRRATENAEVGRVPPAGPNQLSAVKFAGQLIYDRRGSSTPEVARTVLQTADLIQPFGFPKDRSDRLGEISVRVMEHLVASLDIFERVCEQVRAGQEKIDLGILNIQAGGQAVTLPSVINLRKEAEGFLYNGKLALRDIGELFDVFWGQSFGNRYHKAKEWAVNTFGRDSVLGTMLWEDGPWIEQVIRFRNAVEHPNTEPGGPLKTRDFSLATENGTVVVVEPVWQQGDYVGRIVADMAAFQSNFLTLYEDLLVEGLSQLGGPFTFYEIRADRRNPAMPKRLAVTLRGLPPPLEE